ncbi:hypothetical protein CRENBAI_006587 [Crenichthys baileyi]|uniref:Uncharacterized protein n=1 Tax=Crenichthys baileyi TaxID=28760 RepID=A0AAV9R1D7_9TELE
MVGVPGEGDSIHRAEVGVGKWWYVGEWTGRSGKRRKRKGVKRQGRLESGLYLTSNRLGSRLLFKLLLMSLNEPQLQSLHLLVIPRKEAGEGKTPVQPAL